MSSSTTADTSAALPATRPESRLTATGWLRVALIAALAATAVSIVFDLVVAERVVDRAVAHDSAHASALDHAPLAVPEPFSRRGQRAGLVLGELLLAGGVAFLLAGAATLLSPRSRSPRRLWILVGTAGLVGVVLYPALVYPPLPPGVASGLEIGDRQLLYLITVALGIGAVAAAVCVASRSWHSVAAAAACLVVPALLALALLPDQRAADTVGHRLLAEFRGVSIASQVLFWGVLTAVGALLLQRRDAA
jgi:Probable cobalt transporter subunit (CbtA)